MITNFLDDPRHQNRDSLYTWFHATELEQDKMSVYVSLTYIMRQHVLTYIVT